MPVICSADVGLRDTNTAMLGRTIRRRARVKILIMEGSKVDLVDYGHVTLEVHYVVENKPMTLTDRVGTDNPLLCWHLAQVSILDMVLYVRDALEGARLLLVQKLLVSDANNTLGLLVDDGKWIR